MAGCYEFRFRTFSAIAVIIGVAGFMPEPTAAQNVGFNQKGNFLIADQLNNRVIEIDPTGRIVWQFGVGPGDTSPQSILGVSDAQRVGMFTLMAGAGVPGSGLIDNRVLLVAPSGNIVWQFGKFGVVGSGPNELNSPVQSTWIPGALILISDQGNHRVIKVNLMHQIVWQYGITGQAGLGTNQLNSPASAELIPNGNILIADQGNNRVIEIGANNQIVKTFTAGGTLRGVSFASRLPNGDTLITDTDRNRIVEVNQYDQIVWQYATNQDSGSVQNPYPTRAVRLKTGQTLISDQLNDRVILLDTQSKKIVMQFGTTDSAGYNASSASGALNAPADAKMIGDYTGLSLPATSWMIPAGSPPAP